MTKVIISIRSTLAANPISPVVWFYTFLGILSFVAWYFAYQNGVTLAYNDAMSHLNIARLVFDNAQPGFSQLGGVWLPLNHLLSLGLVWNYWAWQSGLAGSLVSMTAFVISAFALFHVLYEITDEFLASIIGVSAFALNANMLYLQTTPLTEPLYVALFCLSALVFVKWIKYGQTVYLLLLGFLGFLQVLTRYDGWFVTGLQALLIFGNVKLVSRKSAHEALSKTLLYSLPVLFGIALWLGWNLLIFNDPFFFATGPYSARAQQKAIEQAGELATHGNLLVSTLTFYYAVVRNLGIITFVLSLFGVSLLYVKRFSHFKLSQKQSLMLFLLTPIIFNVIALFLGFSIVSVPELMKTTTESSWFNIRYGIVALPWAAVMIGIIAKTRQKYLPFLLFALLVIQLVLMVPRNISTLADGTIGSSAFREHALAEALKTRIKPNEKVLVSVATYNPVLFKSGLELKQLIHEGVYSEWNVALSEPQKHVDWIVMAKDPEESVHKALVENHANVFREYFSPVYTGTSAIVYQKIHE